ncbi:MAG: hypothetical protein HeimC2_17740 [Candidatus Heimdallarchaeota archaeon LC_2]|nr:MAG: hypothetical protein HeimC2_17740 [Candidatus Heimdallarchaeota archaeon LC_2]
MRKKTVETCEMCSSEVYNPVTIKVEGALLNVCSNCISFGNIVEKPRAAGSRSSQSSGRFPVKSGMRSSSRLKFKPKINTDDKELTSDFADIIRSARMKRKITHDQLASKTGLSIPFIKSMEAGKVRPTDSAAKKLERELKVSLLITPDLELEYAQKSRSKATTLGDIAVIKKFEYDEN